MSAQSEKADQLRGLAEGDFTGIDAMIEMHESALAASGLDSDAFQLAQIAALAAIDGPPVSWLIHLGVAAETELDFEKVFGTLIAVAPIIGTPKVVSAASNIVAAAGLADELDDEDE